MFDKDSAKWLEKRKSLVEHLKKAGYVNKPEVERAMMKVPRHVFVPMPQRAMAYNDRPLPIGQGQTISAPHMVALMAEKLQLEKGQKVLEVGGGSGYHASVIAEVIGKMGKVYSVEVIPELVKMAIKSLKKVGLEERVETILADGSIGYPQEAPYDRIFVACAAPDLPPPLLEQLGPNGIMLIPVENGMGYQDLMMYEKKDGKLVTHNQGGCVFVPLVGKWGH